MRALDLAGLLPEIVLRVNDEKNSPVFLTLTGRLPILYWNDDSLEQFLLQMIDQAVSKSLPEHPVRLALIRRERLEDVEALVQIHPASWTQLKIETQSADSLEPVARETFQTLGFRCEDEWPPERSGCRFIAYSRDHQPAPAILVWIQEHKATRRYIFLIPVLEPAGNFSAA